MANENERPAPIKIGGELEPQTVDYILGTAETIIDDAWDKSESQDSKRQSAINSYLQDEIEDIQAESWGELTPDTIPEYNSGHLITSGGVYTGITAAKTFTTGEIVPAIGIDTNPTNNSTNLVKSGGVKAAIDNVAFSTNEKVNQVGIDSTPTPGSDNLVKSGGVQNELALGAVYNVSAKNPTAGPNNDGKWESLSTLLSDANLNTLIPTSVRKGGMSIKFVQSSDNKYVQYRLMADSFTTDITQWQGVDNEPILNSKNILESGGTLGYITENLMYKYNKSVYNESIDVDSNGTFCIITIKIKAGDTVKIQATGKSTVWNGLWIYYMSEDSYVSYARFEDSEYMFTAPADVKSIALRISDYDYVASGTVAVSVSELGYKDFIESKFAILENNFENLNVALGLDNTTDVEYTLSDGYISNTGVLSGGSAFKHTSPISVPAGSYLIVDAKVASEMSAIARYNNGSYIPLVIGKDATKKFVYIYKCEQNETIVVSGNTNAIYSIFYSSQIGGVFAFEEERIDELQKTKASIVDYTSTVDIADALAEGNTKYKIQDKVLHDVFIADSEKVITFPTFIANTSFRSGTFQTSNGIRLYYYPVKSGDILHITATNEVGNGFGIGWSQNVPSLGDPASVFCNSNNTSVDKTVEITQNGYILINKYKTNYDNFVVRYMTNKASWVDDEHYKNVFNCLCSKLTAIGDSLTEGAIFSNNGQSSLGNTDFTYPTLMGKAADAKVDVCAKGGKDSKYIYANGAELIDYVYTNVYIVWLGTNGGYTLSAYSDVDMSQGWQNYPDTYIGAYCKLIDRIIDTNPNAMVVLVNINAGGTAGDTGATLEETQQVIRQVAIDRGLLCIETSEYTRQNYPSWHPQGNLHFNLYGYTQLADIFASQIGKYMETNYTELTKMYEYGIIPFDGCNRLL